MNFLFLRGQVPQDRNPKQIMFDRLEDCDDMWTQLAYALSKDDNGEVWYWNGVRCTNYKNNFIERWKPSFKYSKYEMRPDVIFARGGFKEYDQVLSRYPDAFKIYYGAGKRFYPKTTFKDYDLILVDTEVQLREVRRMFPNIKSNLIIKPVAENIFKPIKNDNKVYDFILVGNYSPKVDKGHDFAFKRIPKKYKVLCAGIVPKKIRNKYKHVDFVGWLPRKRLPELYSKSKAALVCCGIIDSCPRVIPEAIACNCPILVLDRIKISQDRYVTEETGILSSEKNFVNNLNIIVKEYKKFNPYNYYVNNLSIQKSVSNIKENL